MLCDPESYMKTQFLPVMVDNVHNPRTLESEAGDFQFEHLNAQFVQRQKTFSAIQVHFVLLAVSLN